MLELLEGRTLGPQGRWSEQAASDMRRTARAVKAATRMAEHASASLPAHMQTWKEVIALYRLLDADDVTRVVCADGAGRVARKR